MVSALLIFLRKYFHSALATSAYYLPIAKNSWENFHSKLENGKSLAQQIFPRLQYMLLKIKV